jgi:hypothetical protein
MVTISDFLLRHGFQLGNSIQGLDACPSFHRCSPSAGLQSFDGYIGMLEEDIKCEKIGDCAQA